MSVRKKKREDNGRVSVREGEATEGERGDGDRKEYYGRGRRQKGRRNEGTEPREGKS